MAIAGVSGSPIQGGNTDRLVQSLLVKSAHASTFIIFEQPQFHALSWLCPSLCQIRYPPD